MTKTLIPNPTTADLVGLIGYFRTDAEVEAAGFAFDQGTPEVGEVVAIHSRGGYRRAVVTSVTRTGTVKAVYVTEGGLAEAQRFMEQAQATFANVENVVDKMEAQDRKNHAWTVEMANGTADLYRRFTYEGDKLAASMAEYQAKVEAVEAQGGIEAIISADRPGRIEGFRKAATRTVLDRVTETTGTAKAGKVARLA